jgi:hypothetical protein
MTNIPITKTIIRLTVIKNRYRELASCLHTRVIISLRGYFHLIKATGQFIWVSVHGIYWHCVKAFYLIVEYQQVARQRQSLKR